MENRYDEQSPARSSTLLDAPPASFLEMPSFVVQSTGPETAPRDDKTNVPVTPNLLANSSSLDTQHWQERGSEQDYLGPCRSTNEALGMNVDNMYSTMLHRTTLLPHQSARHCDNRKPACGEEGRSAILEGHILATRICYTDCDLASASVVQAWSLKMIHVISSLSIINISSKQLQIISFSDDCRLHLLPPALPVISVCARPERQAQQVFMIEAALPFVAMSTDQQS
eukprot:6174755-Pleurochrysis_carterae.AAC.3